MGWLYRYSIRHPWAVSVIAIVVSLAVAPGALRLEIRTDGHALVPPNDPEVLLDRQVREEFATEDMMVVLIRPPDQDSIFTPGTLQLVKDLTAEILAIEGLRDTDVTSLATEHGHRVWPGTINARRFLEPLPETEEELARLQSDLRAIRLYTGTLLSPDEKATSILVGVPPTVDRTGLYRRISKLVEDKGKRPERIDVIGAPVAEALLGTHLLEDLGVPDAILGQTTGTMEAGGFPSSFYELRLFLASHLGLVPVAIAIMGVVFLVSFRSIAGVALPLLEVGACLAFVFGLMGWCGVPVYLTIAVMPVILTAIGVADEIHIIARYREHLRDRGFQNHTDGITATMSEMASPVVKTSVTTAVGFLSFAISPIGPVRAFGIFTSIGVIYCMLWSLTVTPALLQLMGPRRWGKPRPVEVDEVPTPRRSLFGLLARVVVRARYLLLLAALFVVCLAPGGVRKIVVQDSWIDGFAEGSPFYKATSYFNEHFLGTHLLLLALDTGYEHQEGVVSHDRIAIRQVRIPGDVIDDPKKLIGWRIRIAPVGKDGKELPIPPRRRRGIEWKSWVEKAERKGDDIIIEGRRQDGSPKFVLRAAAGAPVKFEFTKSPLLSPDTLRRIAEFESFLEGHKAQTVGGVLGTADYIETTNLMVRGLQEDARVIPQESYQVDNLWKHYVRIRGNARRSQMADAHYARALIAVFMKNANFVDTKALMDDIRRYEEEHLKPFGFSLEFAGDVAVSQTLIGAIVSTQIRSLMLSLVGILLVTTIMGRSLLWGFLCVLPCAIAVLVNFAVMGWVGVPLGVATSMFAGMTLGIGVDYAIHLLERFRRARRQGMASPEALSDAITATGPAIFIDAVAVALGFGVMILSQVPANARLGGLVVLSIVGCFAATFLLLPALLRVFVREPQTEKAEGCPDESSDRARHPNQPS